MIRNHLPHLTLFVTLVFALPPPGLAASAPQLAANPSTPERLAANKAWSAYRYRDKKGLVCYLVGKPAKMEPAAGNRNASLLVTHDNGENTRNVVSLVPGYAYKDGSSVSLLAGAKSFELFTKGDRAWARDAATDKAVVEALRRAKNAVFKGTPAKGAATTDTYVLSGFPKTLDEIDKACPLPGATPPKAAPLKGAKAHPGATPPKH